MTKQTEIGVPSITRRVWSALSSASSMAILAIIGFGLSIYLGFFYEKQGAISILVTSYAKVFDIRKPVGGLEVSYAGQDLRQAKKALWSVSLSINNSGNSVIKQGDFDEGLPVGVSVQGGEIVDAPAVQTDVPYIRSRLQLVSDKGRVGFRPIVLEAGDSIRIVFLVLGDENTRPVILPVGKIAGSKEISLGFVEDRAQQPGMVYDIFGSESSLSQVARLFGYGVVFLVLIASIVGASENVQTLREKVTARLTAGSRARRASNLLTRFGESEQIRRVIGIYVRYGESLVADALAIFAINDKRVAFADHLRQTGELDPLQLRRTVRLAYPSIPVRRQSFEVLEAHGIVKSREDGTIEVSDETRRAFYQVAKELDIHPTKQWPTFYEV